MWNFCFRSLVREYGWHFAARVAVRRPLRTLKAVHGSRRLDVSGGTVDVGGGWRGGTVDGRPSIVGVGFCLKPITPPCPSGRANHECMFLERLTGADASGVPVPCRQCAIREIGTRALGAGSAFYVMTSARDILYDVFVPAIAGAAFPAGLFVLCRYSFQPFAVGLLASGISGTLIALEQGDCGDYRTWLLADRGIKNERTTVDGARLGVIGRLLAAAEPLAVSGVERRGHVLYPPPGKPEVGEVAGAS